MKIAHHLIEPETAKYAVVYARRADAGPLPPATAAQLAAQIVEEFGTQIDFELGARPPIHVSYVQGRAIFWHMIDKPVIEEALQ
ncbi:hypothetical protein [Microcystis phage Mel-JY33]